MAKNEFKKDVTVVLQMINTRLHEGFETLVANEAVWPWLDALEGKLVVTIPAVTGWLQAAQRSFARSCALVLRDLMKSLTSLTK